MLRIYIESATCNGGSLHKELKICVFEYTSNTSCGPSNLKKNLYCARFSQSSTAQFTKLSVSLDKNVFAFFVWVLCTVYKTCKYVFQ